MRSDLLEAICSLIKELGRLVTEHGAVKGGLQLLPAIVGEVQMPVRLYAQAVPEEVGKVYQPLLNVVHLLGRLLLLLLLLSLQQASTCSVRLPPAHRCLGNCPAEAQLAALL